MAISDYFVALALTLVVETFVAMLFGYSSYTAVKTIVLVNLMSHPLLTYFLCLNHSVGFVEFRTAVVVLEILVVILEWRLLVFALRDQSKRLLAMSTAMNLASFITGLIVFPI